MRTLVAALVVANLLFLAWTQGLLDDVVGVRAAGDREPERLAQQVRPELIRPIDGAASAAPREGSGAPPPGAASTPAATANEAPAAVTPVVATSAAATECLQAGPFNAAEAASAEARLQAVVPGLETARFQRTAIEPQPPVWAVYMGRFANAEAVRAKQEELGRLRMSDAEELRDGPPEYVPGLVLARFETKAAAQAGLAKLEQRGVRTARVVQLAAGGTRELLRLEAAPPGIAAQVKAVAEGPFAAHRFEGCEVATR